MPVIAAVTTGEYTLTPSFDLPRTCVSIQNKTINKLPEFYNQWLPSPLRPFSPALWWHTDLLREIFMLPSQALGLVMIIKLWRRAVVINCILLSSAFFGTQSVAVALVHLSPFPSTLHSDTREHNYCSMKTKWMSLPSVPRKSPAAKKAKTSHFPSNSSFGWT